MIPIHSEIDSNLTEISCRHDKGLTTTGRLASFGSMQGLESGLPWSLIHNVVSEDASWTTQCVFSELHFCLGRHCFRFQDKQWKHC
ncbi:unnamed protein product [Cuscuta campestris]|uniref:Uncharacterized protein n=1 Tax=Cuscuta campestris TaxID=132261 RepID=A0A484N026_9ASTE|nr:unnamed protein product [Cuscuta campestris]